VVPALALDGGKYSISADFQKLPGVTVVDTDYRIFAAGSLDHVFVGPRLEAIPRPVELLQALVPKLRQGGHLVIHVAGDRLEELRGYLRDLAGWQEKITYLREGQTLGVWKLVAPAQRVVHPPKPRAPKRACVVRYGALGDIIMITPLLRDLAERGYEVTLNITPYCLDVLKGNPHVHNIILQERDIIPNKDLGDYWNEWRSEYEVYINLSESIEGGILRVEGRRDFYTSKDWRLAQTGKTNYYTQTLLLGGVPPERAGGIPQHGELYLTQAERKQARFLRSKFPGKKLILWGLKGSSYHKQFPMLRPFLSEWLPQHPEVQVLLVGAAQERGLGYDDFQVANLAGEIPLREVFALAEQVDCVVGPESAIINAAGCFATPKVVLRSHSTCGNLCAGWANHQCLAPHTACHPCQQLHYSEGSCPLIQIEDTTTGEQVWKGPACCASISFEELAGALEKALATPPGPPSMI
jgi:ADP-heptose:LPS heptosyltransferase